MQRRNLDLPYEDLFVTFSGEILVPAEDQISRALSCRRNGSQQAAVSPALFGNHHREDDASEYRYTGGVTTNKRQ
jgi:hypothetical protein